MKWNKYPERKCLSLQSQSNPLLIINLIILIIKTGLALESERVLSFNETKAFQFSNDKKDWKLNITYIGLENVYTIENEYSFILPVISVECECVCKDKDEMYCNEKSKKKQETCACLSNSTATCTIYNSFNSNEKICPKYYKLCCETFFSKHKLGKIYRAFQIKYKTSNFKLRLELADDQRKNITLNIPEKNFLQITPEYILQLYKLNHSHILSEGWYFAEIGSTELLYTKRLNGKTEKILNKLGWYQFSEREKPFIRVRKDNLKDHLHVTPLNCGSEPLNFEWKFNATGYSNKGSVQLPEDAESVLEMNKNSISNISSSFTKKELTVEAKYPLNARLSFDNVSTLPFSFVSSISISPIDLPILKLTIKKANSALQVEIKNSLFEVQYAFKTKFINASFDYPVIINHPLPFNNYQSSVVCVFQYSYHICDLPEIKTSDAQILIMPKMYSNTTLNSSYNKTEKVNIENSTQNHKSEQNLFAYLIGTFSVVIILILIFIFRKRIIRKNWGNSYYSPIFYECVNVDGKNPEERIALKNSTIAEKLERVTTGDRLEAAMLKISQRITREKFRIFARKLGLPENRIDEIENICNRNQYDDPELITQALDEWIKEMGDKATLDELMNILTNIGTEDVVRELFDVMYMDLQEKQKRLYRNIQFYEGQTINLVPLEEIFNEIILNGIEEQGLENGRNIEKVEIFEGLDNIEKPRLLLVEHQHRCKSSFLLLSFLADWSRGVKYISEKFDLVFVISAKGLATEDVTSELLKQCEDIKGTNEEKLHTIKALKNRVLLLLENLDDASEEIQHKFLPLLNGFQYPNMTVAVISRSGDLHLKDESEILLKKMGSEPLEKLTIWGKQIYFKDGNID